MSVAILLSTCDAYRSVAEFTLGRLDALWPEHPEVFVCGLGPGGAQPGRGLPLTADPRDWVGIALDAVTELQVRGFEWLYLILDDHPPFGPCNADFLNRRLPEQAKALQAIQVNLLGWDQYQPQEGAVFGRDRLFWQQNSPSFPWKFSLHPGLWHAQTLVAILRSLRSLLPDARSARAFEGHLDDACRALDPRLLERTWRVRGDGFAVGHRWYEARLSRMLTAKLLHAARSATGLAGEDYLAKLDAAVLPYCCYLNGPYPMFWSGLLRQGRLHENALRFLALIGRRRQADDVRARFLKTGALS